MFTGIVKEIGRIKELRRGNGLVRIAVGSREVYRSAGLGDSIAVNGVCLTVSKKGKEVLYFDAVEETLGRTTLGSAREGDLVNLEGSLKAGEKIGGHFVTGHVDYAGSIKDITRSGADVAFEIVMPEGLANLVAEKGSVAVDGVSLTVGEVKKSGFKVYLIPHTLKATTLGMKRTSDRVNVEFDIIGRYVARQAQASPRSNITEALLKEKGF